MSDEDTVIVDVPELPVEVELPAPIVFQTQQDFEIAVMGVLMRKLGIRVNITSASKWMCNGYSSQAVTGVGVALFDTDSGETLMSDKEEVE